MIINGINWYIEQPTKEQIEEKYNSSYYHVKNEKECKICKIKFKYGQYNNFNCNLHKVFAPCPTCNRIHEINFNNLSGTQKNEIFYKIENNEKIFNCCSIECRNKLIYQIQKDNQIGICSKESIKKRNSSKYQKIRSQHSIENGTKIKCVKGQLKNGTHPTQNLDLQSRKCLLMQLHNLGMKDLTLSDLEDKKYIDYLNLIPLKISGNSITYEDSFNYNNRCGSIGLYGTYKKDGKRYALNAGKSKNLGKEIRKFWRIISQPYKQDINYDYGRWYHIANDYENFEICIICIDVTEQEALLQEAAWSYQNDANFKYTINARGNKIQIPRTHGYWM